MSGQFSFKSPRFSPFRPDSLRARLASISQNSSSLASASTRESQRTSPDCPTKLALMSGLPQSTATRSMPTYPVSINVSWRISLRWFRSSSARGGECAHRHHQRTELARHHSQHQIRPTSTRKLTTTISSRLGSFRSAVRSHVYLDSLQAICSIEILQCSQSVSQSVSQSATSIPTSSAQSTACKQT